MQRQAEILNFRGIIVASTKVVPGQRIFSDGPWRSTSHNTKRHQMGKKRTHAEIKDGSATPSLEKKRPNVKNNSKDKRKNGEVQKQRSQLVCISSNWWTDEGANVHDSSSSLTQSGIRSSFQSSPPSMIPQFHPVTLSTQFMNMPTGFYNRRLASMSHRTWPRTHRTSSCRQS